MALRLYNTLSGKIEDFHPLDGNRVRMYACGPTVYDYGHIGNFRTFIAVDLLYRYLRQSGYDVRYVMNITDVDDKIIRNSARDGVTVQQYTAKFAQAFLEDSATLSIRAAGSGARYRTYQRHGDLHSRTGEERSSRTVPTTAPTISALRSFPGTASFRKKILPA